MLKKDYNDFLEKLNAEDFDSLKHYINSKELFVKAVRNANTKLAMIYSLAGLEIGVAIGLVIFDSLLKSGFFVVLGHATVMSSFFIGLWFLKNIFKDKKIEYKKLLLEIEKLELYLNNADLFLKLEDADLVYGDLTSLFIPSGLEVKNIVNLSIDDISDKLLDVEKFLGFVESNKFK